MTPKSQQEAALTKPTLKRCNIYLHAYIHVYPTCEILTALSLSDRTSSNSPAL